MTPRRRPSLVQIADAGIATLFPGYFALVMATGIVSIACALLGIGVLPDALFVVNVCAYAILWALTGVRIVRHGGRMLADLRQHARSPGYFTTVAATCILGTQCLVLYGATDAARALWFVGIALWLLIIYAFFLALSVGELKPRLGNGINGAWLIAIVATQAVAVLGTLLLVAGDARGDDGRIQAFFCLCMFLFGCFLYLPFITMILYRFAFESLEPATLTPPYWINMGAVAITNLAGSVLLLATDKWELLATARPFLLGFTCLFWAAATWWIPLLILLGVWRHGIARYPLRYDPQYWGLVFPLGMYTVATLRLSEAAEIGFLSAIPRVTVYFAIAAWALAFFGLAHRLFGIVRERRLPTA